MSTTLRRNPHRIYRNRDKAIIAGVCAGIAHYFGAGRFAIRLLAMFALILVPPVTGILYLIAAWRLPPQPEALFHSTEEEQFWRQVSHAPAHTFGQLRHQMRDLEHRLRAMEAHVTSSEFQINRELK